MSEPERERPSEAAALPAEAAALPAEAAAVPADDAGWRERLTPEQYQVLRREATERAGSSPLNDEKRPGTFVCAGCGQPLFRTETKYESGSGWPSFFAPLPGALGTKRDFRLVWPRVEYHCANCGGHQGHLFDDGPAPTGQRYCNNGVALHFVPDGQG